jgi:hypothetical protein
MSEERVGRDLIAELNEAASLAAAQVKGEDVRRQDVNWKI